MFPGYEGGRCVGLKTLQLSCADSLEIWELNLLELSRPVQACNGIAFSLAERLRVEVLRKLMDSNVHKWILTYT
jgi:hypothetical protein